VEQRFKVLFPSLLPHATFFFIYKSYLIDLFIHYCESVIEGRKLTARSILTVPPAYSPGSKTEYSNYNYIIAGAILEKLSGIYFFHLI
jgi:CubicO group peptidase (beta-lactamase class C family)